MLTVDAHLDLGDMAFEGRNLILPAMEQSLGKYGPVAVSFPDLHAANVGLICGTLFTDPAVYRKGEVDDPSAAHQQADWQVRWYLEQEAAGRLQLVRHRSELPSDADLGNVLRTIILMENADPIQKPSDAAWWFERGVRIVGMAWQRTRYAGGTRAPGGLTSLGRDLVKEFDRLGIIHDISHLAEQSFWNLLEMTQGPIMASHSNCRALIPTDRQISDDMIRAIAQRGGVIGINFFDRFLISEEERKRRRATLADVMTHVKHVCDLLGNADHIGIGTDLDGGLGRNDIPKEMTTAADLTKLPEAAANAGFSDTDIRKLMHGNWLRFFREKVPD